MSLRCHNIQFTCEEESTESTLLLDISMYITRSNNNKKNFGDKLFITPKFSNTVSNKIEIRPLKA